MRCSTYPIEKNYMIQYAKLWDIVNDRQFTLDEARDFLPDVSHHIKSLISKLRDNGWLSNIIMQTKKSIQKFRLHTPIDIMINISETVEQEIKLIRKINDVPDDMKTGGRIIECPICTKLFKYYSLHPPKCCSEECYVKLTYFRKENFRY